MNSTGRSVKIIWSTWVNKVHMILKRFYTIFNLLYYLAFNGMYLTIIRPLSHIGSNITTLIRPESLNKLGMMLSAILNDVNCVPLNANMLPFTQHTSVICHGTIVYFGLKRPSFSWILKNIAMQSQERFILFWKNSRLPLPSLMIS